MASQTNVTTLLAAVRRRAYLPVTGGPSDADLCAQLTEELLTFVSPLLMVIGEEFFVDTDAFSTVAGTSAYDIPAKSIGAKLRDVQVLLTDGVTWVSIAHEEPERAVNYANSAQIPCAYFLRANQIVLLPTPQGVQSMRILYYRRPRTIVSTGYSVASVASGPSAGNYTVTVASTTGMTSGSFDVLDSTTYEILSEALPGTVTNATTLTFPAAGLDADQITALLASAGDTYIGAGQAPVADVPPEAAILLTQRVAAIILQELGDPRMAQAFSEVERVKYTLQQLFAPRASGRPRRVVNMSGPGWGGRRSWGRGGAGWGY